MEENTTWLHEFYLPITAESIHRKMDYYLTSTHYKNTLFIYISYGLTNHLNSLHGIRRKSILCYRELTKILGLEAEVLANPLAYKIDFEDYADYIGTYEGSNMTLEISIEGDRIYGQLNDSEKDEIFHIKCIQLISNPF